MATNETNGQRTRRTVNPEAFEVVSEVPPVTRRGGSRTRKSKWDKLNEYLRANPGVTVRYQDVSASTGTDLTKRFNLFTENRSVEGYEEARVDLYVSFDADYEKQLIKERRAKEAAKAKEAAAAGQPA